MPRVPPSPWAFVRIIISMDKSRFEVEIDGRGVARCWRSQKEKYANGSFEAGIVEGIGRDTIYFRIDQGEAQPFTIFMRPDEAMLLIHLLSGAMWAQKMLELRDSDDEG
jgi:hypothetical protein